MNTIDGEELIKAMLKNNWVDGPDPTPKGASAAVQCISLCLHIRNT